MSRQTKRLACIGLVSAILLSFTACGRQEETYTEKDNDNEDYVLQPVGNYFTEELYEYTNEGVRQSAEKTFVSEDGLCTILSYPDYYDVTLDYEKGTPDAVGAAYAKTIPEAFPSYAKIMEPYIYENIKMAFSGQSIDYDALEKRMNVLLSSIPEDYRTEIKAFAAAISNGEKGFMENGKISYEEAIIVQMIPDALRPTSCSALSLWGSKTESGAGITLRCLEWYEGSENQMGKVNAVVHMLKGDRSILSIGMLGILDMISAINDDGVFVAILDVGNYMVANSGDFTWCHNLIITDANHSYCAENCVREVAEAGKAFSVLRDADTPIMEGLNWENKDSLCVLNSFMTEGNQDGFTGSQVNLIRFEKYNKWVAAREKFTPADVKEMITQEKTGQHEVENVHRQGAVHLVLIDYDTGSIQAAFTGEKGLVDKPVFYEYNRRIKKRVGEAPMTDILVIEDNKELGTLICDFLKKDGFSVEWKGNAEEGLKCVEKAAYKMLLLDVMLPETDGYEMLQIIRRKHNIPVLMMSAKTDDQSKILGLDVGADDYLDKPFSFPVLSSKVKAILRRSYEMPEKKKLLVYRDITVDVAARTVTRNGKEISVTGKEYDILCYFMQYPGQVIHKETLFNAVWGCDCFSEINTLNVYVRWLREKLEDDPRNPKLIQTVWKVGYRFGGRNDK